MKNEKKHEPNKEYLAQRFSWLPDWRQEDQYPDPSTMTGTNWAWEFLRRQPHYGNLRKSLIGESKLSEIDLHEARNIVAQSTSDRELIFSEEDRPLTQVIELMEIFYGRFGLLTFPPAPENATARIKFEDRRIFFRSESQSRRHYEPEETFLGFNEALCTIDMELPIDPQLKKIKETIRQRIGMRNTQENSPSSQMMRMRTSKYLLYLRVLDADIRGIDLKEMADVFGMDNSYDDDFRGEKTLRWNLMEAKRLRDSGYRQIAKIS
ncbi:transcriptional regulator domain-containing protein [Micavibrio aeruginosavorus]|uniref:Transcriptional regulator-like domain-containing protein n=1 Tax=Micavibrio aeruginosavorus EPB TaxID=349215 RepID=M4VX97_9BACT|nr:DUF6499 domain-containing protein [Micavibrio aeruginosavorus]AGH97824.1 hypothetical protein A11S_1004 [Micavibrio aeruginosavorus EPB]